MRETKATSSSRMASALLVAAVASPVAHGSASGLVGFYVGKNACSPAYSPCVISYYCSRLRDFKDVEQPIFWHVEADRHIRCANPARSEQSDVGRDAARKNRDAGAMS